jgi:inosose dehydratase
VNLDTGNLWLGGGDPVEMVRALGPKIEHVHWKDLPAEMEPRRGTIYGCGMGPIPLGTGAIDIRGTFEALVAAGFDGCTTLEVFGETNVLQSRDYLRALGAV